VEDIQRCRYIKPWKYDYSDKLWIDIESVIYLLQYATLIKVMGITVNNVKSFVSKDLILT
jgi:hypothetical protein